MSSEPDKHSAGAALAQVRAPTARRAALLACAALAIGSLAPWSTSVAGSHAGVAGDGLYTLLAALLAAALLLLPGRSWAADAVIALGAFCAVVAAYDVVDVARSTREAVGNSVPSLEVAWGLWLTFLAALALALAAYLLRAEETARAPRAAEPRRSAVARWARADPSLAALAALLGLGLALRVWFTALWSPALTGYSDTGIYFTGAVESLWSDPLRMAGYSMFLRALHAIVPHLIAVTIVQHAIGLGAAALVFFAVRRCGGPRGLGLAPAAVIALGGDELFIEHAALSDSLFVFLIVATLYCTLRASREGARWAALAGLCAGLAVWDRTVGLGLVAVIALWLTFSAGRPSRRSLVAAALALALALATVGAYAAWRSAASDMPGLLNSNNAWNLYGRVAPWADCGKFTPPPGTGGLCEATPASKRGYRSGEEYIYSSQSPAQRLFGPPYRLSPVPHAMRRLQEWSEAAIRGEPLAYLHAVWRDTVRLFSPSAPSYGDLSANALIAYLLYGPDRHSGANEFVEYWQSRLYPHDPPAHHGDIQLLRVWEAITRVDGFWMALLLALCLAAPWLPAGRARAGAILFAATALLLLFLPILVKGYDYRFAIPAFAPLTAAAALSAWGLLLKARARLAAPAK